MRDREERQRRPPHPGRSGLDDTGQCPDQGARDAAAGPCRHEVDDQSVGAAGLANRGTRRGRGQCSLCQSRVPSLAAGRMASTEIPALRRQVRPVSPSSILTHGAREWRLPRQGQGGRHACRKCTEERKEEGPSDKVPPPNAMPRRISPTARDKTSSMHEKNKSAVL